MERRRFPLTSLAGALAAPSAAGAQQVGKVYRIGLLEGPFPPIWDTRYLLPGALHSLGYVEGRQVSDSNCSREPCLASPAASGDGGRATFCVTGMAHSIASGSAWAAASKDSGDV